MGQESVRVGISPTLFLVFGESGKKQWNGIAFDEVVVGEGSVGGGSVGEGSVGEVVGNSIEQSQAVGKSVEQSQAVEKSIEQSKIVERTLKATSPRQLHSSCIQKSSPSRSTNLLEKKQISLLEKQLSHLKDLETKSKMLEALQARGEMTKLRQLIAQWEDACCLAVEAFQKQIPDEKQANAALRGLFASYELDPASLGIDIGPQEQSEEEPEAKESGFYYDD